MYQDLIIPDDRGELADAAIVSQATNEMSFYRAFPQGSVAISAREPLGARTQLVEGGRRVDRSRTVFVRHLLPVR